MSKHEALITWHLNGPDFTKGQYSREHTWTFDGGVTVTASASPSVVAAPWSNPTHVDPEESFVAAVSSCHMLTFLWLASRAGWIIESYSDRAVGQLTTNDKDVPWVSRIVLEPRVVWRGAEPSATQMQALHHDAHEKCFIAQSIKSEVVTKLNDV